MIEDLKGVLPGRPHTDCTGTINHLRLTVSDIKRAKTLYSLLLHELGYRLVEESASRLAWAGWAPHGTLQWFILSAANPESCNSAHDRYAPGFHHLAWNVRSRNEVDRIYERLRMEGVTILDPPTEYGYEPGYYAVFFSDPDGMKLEVMHVPTEGSLSYWLTFSEDARPRKSRADSEPAFLRTNCCN